MIKPKKNIIMMLLVILFLPIATTDLMSQSVQLSLEVERSMSGVDSGQIFNSGFETDWRVSDAYGQIDDQGVAGCFAIRSKENIPVVVRADLINDGDFTEDHDRNEILIGYINNGDDCINKTDFENSASAMINDNQVSFRLNESPFTIRNLPSTEEGLKGYVLVLSAGQKPDLGEYTTPGQLPEKRYEPVIKIDIEYL